MRTPSNDIVAGPNHDEGELDEIGAILAGMVSRNEASAERVARQEQGRVDFFGEFQTRCEQVVVPAMERVVERLRQAGGGGVVVQRGGDESQQVGQRVTAWMSLDGEIVGAPRQDRHPYLQLDADDAAREVHVSEGDMWAGAGGGQSGRVGEWALAELTGERVTKELVAIIRRSAS